MDYAPHNINNDQYDYEEQMDQWVCSQCSRSIPSTRPPGYNSDNCTCGEVAGGGPVSHPYSDTQPTDIQQPSYHYDHTNGQYGNRAESYATSNGTFQGPEGPERNTPNLQINSGGYLALGQDPAQNYGETQHRRTASFHSNMSYPMKIFLAESGQLQSSEHSGTFLPQDVKLSTSRKVKRGSKPSWVTTDSGGGSDKMAWSWGVGGDVTKDTGAWVEEYGYEDVQRGEMYEYPMVMSGVTDPGN